MAGVIGKGGSVHLFAQERVLARKQPILLPYRVARTNLIIYEPTYPGKTLHMRSLTCSRKSVLIYSFVIPQKRTVS